MLRWTCGATRAGRIGKYWIRGTVKVGVVLKNMNK